MAENDVKIVKHPGPVRQYDTEDTTNSDESSALVPGEPVKRTDGSADYLERLENGDPESGTDEFVGITANDGTETSSADGVVNVYTLVPVLTVLRAKANTSTNVDTSAELLAIMHNHVTFDYDGTDYTIDEDETDDPNVHGLKIIGGDTDNGTLDVIVMAQCCEAGPTI